MRVFAIGDLHLSFTGRVDPASWEKATVSKPMDVFGPEWREHYRRLYENWVKTVGAGDVVLVPGDISWAMRLEEAKYDLEFLGLLPGTIVAVAGNHDYWWQSLSKVRSALPPNVRVIQNDCLPWGGLVFCGSRGWLCPGAEGFNEHDAKIYQRELIRTELSLKEASRYGGELVALTHFMPASEQHEMSGFIELFNRYGVKTAVYGHLHGKAAKKRLPDFKFNINFFLVSADFLNFVPKLIMER